MALKEQVNNDLKAALLGGNRFAGEVLRGLKAAILNEEVAQNKRDEGLDDEAIQKIVAREVKKRNESATIYVQAARPELAETERTEAVVLMAYLPVQLSDDEIMTVVTRLAQASGATGPSAMGQLIGAVKKELGNSADGATIARLVKNALQ
ncbi:MAG: GatB/YqeY domain-containing protein [Candidatus Saccharibacteria bacterium]